MADPCCDSFGGTIYLEIDAERLSPAEGDITLFPGTSEITAMANQDGTAAYQVKPMLPRAEITFRDGCGRDWPALQARCAVNATIVEQTNKRQHLFTGARLTGRAQVNLSTGEVTGLVIEGGRYRRVDG